LYKVEPNTYVSLKADDIEIDNSKKDFRYVHFNITSDIRKLGKNLHINIADRNSVFIKNKALYIEKCMLTVNNSKIYFNGYAARKKNSYIEIFTDKILVSDVLELIDSNIIENNLNEPLAFFYLHDIKLSFIIIVFLLIFIILTIISFYKVSRISAFLLIPYLLWVSFATYLNFELMRLN
jgi:hypothetical protein